MIKHCIIHFGLPKTGTTSIQKFLRHDLADPQFCYPALTVRKGWIDDCHNRALNCAFRSDAEKFHAHAKEGVSRKVIQHQGEIVRDQLRQCVRTSSAHTLLLSAEELSWFPHDDCGALIAFLRDLRVEPTALAYVRQFKRHQESRFQQSVRDPGVRDLSKPRTPGYFPIPYRRCFTSFDTFLSAPTVNLFRFEPSTFQGGCVVSDFCERTGIRLAGMPDRFVNDSMSAEALKLLYAYRLYGPGYGEGWKAMDSNRHLVEKLSELKGPRLLFHSSILLSQEHKWREDLDWACDRAGFDIAGNLFEDDDKSCVRSAEDMFHFSPAALEWLASESGLSSGKLKGGVPEVVAEGVGLLREKVVRNAGAQSGFLARAKNSLSRLVVRLRPSEQSPKEKLP